MEENKNTCAEDIKEQEAAEAEAEKVEIEQEATEEETEEKLSGKEKRKIKKAEAEIARLKGFMTGIQKKLSNERFVQNAPAQVVEMEKKKLADAESKIAALQETVKALKTEK